MADNTPTTPPPPPSIAETEFQTSDDSLQAAIQASIRTAKAEASIRTPSADTAGASDGYLELATTDEVPADSHLNTSISRQSLPNSISISYKSSLTTIEQQSQRTMTNDVESGSKHRNEEWWAWNRDWSCLKGSAPLKVKIFFGTLIAAIFVMTVIVTPFILGASVQVPFESNAILIGYSGSVSGVEGPGRRFAGVGGKAELYPRFDATIEYAGKVQSHTPEPRGPLKCTLCCCVASSCRAPAVALPC